MKTNKQNKRSNFSHKFFITSLLQGHRWHFILASAVQPPSQPNKQTKTCAEQCGNRLKWNVTVVDTKALITVLPLHSACLKSPWPGDIVIQFLHCVWLQRLLCPCQLSVTLSCFPWIAPDETAAPLYQQETHGMDDNISVLTLLLSVSFWTHSYPHLLLRYPPTRFSSILWHHQSAAHPTGVSPWHQRLQPGGGCLSPSRVPITKLFLPLNDPIVQ